MLLNIRSRRSPQWRQRDKLGSVTSLSDPSERMPVVLSLIGVALALLNILIPPYELDFVFTSLPIITIAGATFFAIKSRQHPATYVFAAVNPVLAVFAIYLLVVSLIKGMMDVFALGYFFQALAFSIESAAAILSVRSRGSQSWREASPKPGY